ncbi:MAG: NAD(+) diphosphatase [Fusicatenibacter sp.]|nr:NAD(+) diphosphatase [Fusicatenibacter sp.]
MIQDIAPHVYHVEYKPTIPSEKDMLLIYQGHTILAGYQENQLCYPTISDVRTVFPEIDRKVKFLFRIDDTDYYELRTPELPPFGCWKYEDLSILRNAVPNWLGFAGITGYQIHTWYTDNTFCGRCGTKMRPSRKERAMECPNCHKISYPTICPSVIVAVTNGSRLLLTKYSSTHSSHRNYALVAGYTEVGETLEQTVHREVMEEVGLKVKNLRYYKSQPWSFSGSLLAGFFCEVEGDSAITLDTEELSTAGWFEREELPAMGSAASLTSEMIEYFRNHAEAF